LTERIKKTTSGFSSRLAVNKNGSPAPLAAQAGDGNGGGQLESAAASVTNDQYRP
jgi:hypothetical protein